jgi:hypothetical protein
VLRCLASLFSSSIRGSINSNSNSNRKIHLFQGSNTIMISLVTSWWIHAPPLVQGLCVASLTLLTAFYVVCIYQPRSRGGSQAPPVVTHSPKFPVPWIGPILEFFASPNTMVQRCLQDYGNVFTIPVCIYTDWCCLSKCFCLFHTICPFRHLEIIIAMSLVINR